MKRKLGFSGLDSEIWEMIKMQITNDKLLHILGCFNISFFNATTLTKDKKILKVYLKIMCQKQGL